MSKKKKNPSEKTSTEPQTFSAQDARGGEIILRTRARRVIFIAGLAGCVLLGLLIHVLS